MNKWLLTIVLVFSVPGWAKRFANQYCEFELPTGWECALEGSEWVCQSSSEDRKREAIIILAAKVRGKEDSLGEYQKFLKKSKSYQIPGGTFQNSEPKYTKETMINGHKWIDALHLASEVPGFYTRYLATVKADLGVAVTFSVSKDKYNDYQNVFDRAVQSLRVFRQKNKNLGKVRIAKGETDENFGDTTFIPNEDQFNIAARRGQKKSSGSGGDDIFLYLILLAGIGFYIYKKKKG